MFQVTLSGPSEPNGKGPLRLAVQYRGASPGGGEPDRSLTPKMVAEQNADPTRDHLPAFSQYAPSDRVTLGRVESGEVPYSIYFNVGDCKVVLVQSDPAKK